MRLKITLRATKLPILYRHRFMALIKEALKLSNEDFKNRLYSHTDNTEKVKPFVFSVCPPHFNYDSCPIEEFEITVSSSGIRSPKVKDKVIPIKPDEYISMFVSSSDYEFMVSLYNGLVEMKEFKFNDEIKLSLQKVYMLNEKKINSNEVIFKTLSPILIEEQIVETVADRKIKKDRVILPPMEEGKTDEGFNKVFSSIHAGILEDIRGEKGSPLEFTAIKLRKRVIKHTIRAYWEQHPDKPVMKFTCFEGCFKLKGNPHDLKMLYQIGIGLRTGQGFGMVDVI